LYSFIMLLCIVKPVYILMSNIGRSLYI
jgi:hypothetical protein